MQDRRIFKLERFLSKVPHDKISLSLSVCLSLSLSVSLLVVRSSVSRCKGRSPQPPGGSEAGQSRQCDGEQGKYADTTKRSESQRGNRARQEKPTSFIHADLLSGGRGQPVVCTFKATVRDPFSKVRAGDEIRLRGVGKVVLPDWDSEPPRRLASLVCHAQPIFCERLPLLPHRKLSCCGGAPSPLPHALRGFRG